MRNRGRWEGCAQQLPEKDARKVVPNLVDTSEKAAQMKDAAAIASYTEDSMRVTPDGILYGRAAVEKNRGGPGFGR
jgi:hypothetical protein